MNLTYRNGDVVREVDGAPLDQVVAETQARTTLRNRLLILLAVVLAVVLVAVSVRLYRRRRGAVGHA